jgi:hypothetical protein
MLDDWEPKLAVAHNAESARRRFHRLPDSTSPADVVGALDGGELLWSRGRRSRDDADPHFAELFVPFLDKDVSCFRFELRQSLVKDLVGVFEGRIRIDVGASRRFRDDLVDDPELEEIGGPDVEVFGGLLNGRLFLPENGRAAFRRDDRIVGVSSISIWSPTPMPRAPPLPPSPMMMQMIGTRSPDMTFRL